MEQSLDLIKENAKRATEELVLKAKLQKRDILVVGCSTSEVTGNTIGTESSIEAAGAVFEGIYEIAEKYEIFLAAQCCEHLNRAIIVEKEATLDYRLAIVNVVPQPKAGGSFATTAYKSFREPVAVEHIRAKAGMDIGDTLIGMHLEVVAVPVRLSIKSIGEAHLVCARTRAKFIGGERACYNEELM